MKPKLPCQKTILRSCGLAVPAFLLLQLIPVDRTPGTTVPESDLLRLHPALPAVVANLHTACYDCHSNETHYPWYSRIQPTASWLQWHIRSGRAQVNFSEFGRYSHSRQITKLEMIADAIEDRSMPLASYTWIHRDARLSEEERQAISSWCETAIKQLEEE